MIRTEAAPIGTLSAQRVLFAGRSLDFQSTADQALTKQFDGTNYVVTDVIATRQSGASSVLNVGGVYTGASKSGSAIVGAAQSWLGLSGISKAVKSTLAAVAGTDVLSSGTMFLSLTTGSATAVTANVFVIGVVVD